MARLAVVVALVLTLTACARRSDVTPRLSPAQAPVGTLWRLRLELDSAPGRTPTARRAEGVIASDFANYNLELTPLIGRSLSPAAELSVFKQTDTPGGVSFEITLGDSHSDHNKLVLHGRLTHAGAADSIVGTWVEQSYCCGAAGRFALWRSID